MSKNNKENSVQEQENHFVSLGKDLLSVVAILVIFMVFSKLAFGLWTPMVAVESGSMEPHMQVGDIIFIKSIDRVNVITNEEGKIQTISLLKLTEMSFFIDLMESKG